MRTNLSNIKALLFNGVLDPSYKHFLSNGKSNQQAFMLGFFPLDFLRHEDNQSIIETRSNNSSRLSNIFNRVTEPKRNEEKFRTRFISAFNIDFYKDMVNSCSFFLRNHSKDKFDYLIETILNNDEELSLDENLVIRNYIINNRPISPEKSLAMLLLWAFHIDSFDKILEVINKYESSFKCNTQPDNEPPEWTDLVSYLKSLDIQPTHIKDYMKIVTTYGISGQVGAIALRTYVEQHIDVNPLIYCEVANMLYYGNNYPKSQPINALNMYSACANLGYGPALWTMGQMSNHSRHNSNIKNAMISKEYYKRAYDRSLPLSLNNLGILYHRALVFYVSTILGYEAVDDCFLYDNGSGITEIYHSMKEEEYFQKLLKSYDFSKLEIKPKDIQDEYDCLNILEAAENDILDNYFIPGYLEHDYFYAAGSALTIYEHQYKRKECHFNKAGEDFTMKPEYTILRDKIITTGEYYARYYSSESQYTYGMILEKYDQGDLQNAYDYYYLAAFTTPHKAFRFHALVRFLELHFSGSIMHKKHDIDHVSYLLTYATSHLLPYNPDDKLMLRTMNLMIHHLKLDLKTQLTQSEADILRENLITEMHKRNEDATEYKSYINII